MHTLPVVLFVCVGNCCRSQMAEAFARKHGKGIIEIHSAGSRPAGYIHPLTVELMEEVDAPLDGQWSKGLDEVPQEVDYAITTGCGDECPTIEAKKRLSWDIPDPRDMSPEEFREVRDAIEDKVKDFIQGL